MRIDAAALIGPKVAVVQNAIAQLDDAAFVRFTAALDELFRKPIDLAVAIDCTASMSAEIAAAQAGIDDLMRFINAATGGMRVAIVGFRDQQDEFQLMGWDFTTDPTEARTRLWKLSADGGGDEPEMVYEAMRMAYGKFSWRTEAQEVMVLIGDAPPHPGWGIRTVEMSQAAHAHGITTYVISARSITKTEEVKHFPEIARMGGGRVIRLSDRNDLVAELAGIALSDTWHDQIVGVFERYLQLCR
jgi:Mg-chelatase subunit ChlD